MPERPDHEHANRIVARGVFLSQLRPAVREAFPACGVQPPADLLLIIAPRLDREAEELRHGGVGIILLHLLDDPVPILDCHMLAIIIEDTGLEHRPVRVPDPSTVERQPHELVHLEVVVDAGVCDVGAGDMSWQALPVPLLDGGGPHRRRLPSECPVQRPEPNRLQEAFSRGHCSALLPSSLVVLVVPCASRCQQGPQCANATRQAHTPGGTPPESRQAWSPRKATPGAKALRPWPLVRDPQAFSPARP